MGICWYCYWGWPEPVERIYQDAITALNGFSDPLSFGPAHVVWEDENFSLAEDCLKDFEKYAARSVYSEGDLFIVRQSLEALIRIPIDVRDPEPETYDDEHPEQFPPPLSVVMVKRGR